MRPSHILLIIILFLFLADISLVFHSHRLKKELKSEEKIQKIAVAGLGLTDLCVATEARYTRHPSVSDPVAPFMDHPGALEHFPTGSFWAVRQNTPTR
ncbi:MAG: hypothetical protein JRF02_07875 [Deltaproteobacteria bacterium]|jgi:hypothetical protein|nr:hypothetical protein [Deltaproteobacteria bacterium]